MVKFCPECGIKLDKDYAFCPNCGYKLEHLNKELKKRNSSDINPGVITSTPQHNLGTNKLLAIMGGLILMVVGILFSSGIFDIPKSKEIIQAPVENNQSSGVDLSKMNEIKALEDKVSADPENSQAQLQLANLKQDSGMFESAIINYKKYLDINPSDADARVDLGVCYFSIKNYNQAIAEMKKAIEYNPKHQLAYINLGIVSMSTGNIDDAKKFWQKAVDLDPGSENGLQAKKLLESHK